MLKEVNAEEFREIYKNGLVLADFYSKSCGPCKMLAYVLAEVEKADPELKIIKVDFDENIDLIAQYAVESYPTLILFKEGGEVGRMQGFQQKPAIVKLIETNK